MLFCPCVSRSMCPLAAVALLAMLVLPGCSGGDRTAPVEDRPLRVAPPDTDVATGASANDTASGREGLSPELAEPSRGAEKLSESPRGVLREAFLAGPPTRAAQSPATGSNPNSGESATRPSLDDLLAQLEIPPPWLADVPTPYDTSNPWKDARLEIRRLLGIGKLETHRQAIKLTWIYLQKNDIGDGHEYPMYTFLGGEPLWSIRAHEEFLSKPHEHTPIHAYTTLASLYAQYGEYERAKTMLDTAMSGLPEPPWRVMRQADLLAAYGHLFAAWGKTEEAKRCYAESAALYPTAKPPHGGHLLPRRAAEVQSKLDLLTFRSLNSARLRDGQYRDTTLGYVGDIDVTLVVKEGKIADIKLKHEEKIDQNACVLIPQRILATQSLQVDAISGATVTVDAIVNGVYRCLKKAGLQ